MPDGMQYLLGSITIDGDPYWAAEANYILWGFAWRMFHEHLSAAGMGKTISRYDPLYGPGPGPGPGAGTLKTYYATPYGKMGREVITLDNTLFMVKAWRLYKYGIREGRLFYDNPMPERRPSGLGIEARIPMTIAGWEYYGEGPGKRGDLSAIRPARILDRTVLPNPNSSNPDPENPIKLNFGLGIKPSGVALLHVTVENE